MDRAFFSLEDLPPRVEHADPRRKLSFDDAVKAIEAVLRAALRGAVTLEHESGIVTWRHDARWATLEDAGPHVLALALGDPGGVRVLEPRPADAETVTKLAWDLARHLATSRRSK